MGTDTAIPAGLRGHVDRPESKRSRHLSVRLGVERVGLVLPLWRCRSSFEPSLQSEILDAGTTFSRPTAFAPRGFKPRVP